VADNPIALPRSASPPPRRSIVDLIADGVLDAELAALAGLLVESHLPVIVGGRQPGAGRTTLLEALLDFLPSTTRRIDLAGAAEDFAWLPEAQTVGWQPDHGRGPSQAPVAVGVTPATSYLVAAELSEHLPIYTWGRSARTLVRAASVGYGFGATVHADRLEDVHELLRGGSVGLTEDELTYLGLILILRADRMPDGSVRRRVVAAHYARPVGRDVHGHTQRLPPAILAARDDSTGQLEHFSWGVMPELAIRLGRKAGDLERDQAERSSFLASLLSRGTRAVGRVRAEIRERQVTARVGHGHH